MELHQGSNAFGLLQKWSSHTQTLENAADAKGKEISGPALDVSSSSILHWSQTETVFGLMEPLTC